MKHLKAYKIFENNYFPNTEEEIDKLCRKYIIVGYTINEDMSISVEYGVDLKGFGLNEIPLNFKSVEGVFLCSHNELKSLKGVPNIIQSDFNCRGNSLQSLEYSPKEIKGDFNFEMNNIKNLDYFPKNIEGDIYAMGNPVYNLIENIIDTKNYKELLIEFQDYSIVRGNTVILNRLRVFENDFNIKELDIKRLNDDYKII